MSKHPDAFGTRMKDYEGRETQRKFLPMLPIYARIDGRGFSKFTQGMTRPFDPILSELMIRTTGHLVKTTNARIGYTQSDEISLIWQTDSYDSEMFFDGKIQKLCSVLASMTAAFFGYHLGQSNLQDYSNRLPHFDCRVFQLPNRAEGANAILWREQDATKNAISMAARHYYSAKALHGKSGSEMQEMLFLKGVNFNDYPNRFKRGTFVRRETITVPGSELIDVPEQFRPESATRTQIVEVTNMPKFSQVLNREEVIFDRADPTIMVGEPPMMPYPVPFKLFTRVL